MTAPTQSLSTCLLYTSQRPVPFAGVEEVDAQTGNDLASVTLFLPVEGKGIEMIAAEIEHRINLVLDALAPVSYTHLDVYKRQATKLGVFTRYVERIGVSPKRRCEQVKPPDCLES